MVLELDESILQRFDRFEESRDRAIDALENIAQARRNGFHVLIGSRDLLERLSREESLGRRARGLFARIRDRQAQKANLRRTVSTHLQVVGVGTLERTDNIVQVPLDYFSGGALCRSAILLCENQTDSQLYREFAVAFRRHVRLESVAIRLDNRGGGGSTISEEFEAIQNARDALCLVVCDTDRDAPGCAVGTTLRGLQQVDDEHQPLCKVLPVGAREAENLLPTDLIHSACNQPGVFDREFLALRRLELTTHGYVRLFLDIKDGVRWDFVFGAAPQACHRPYWFDAITNLAEASEPKNGCLDQEKCDAPDACNCPLVGPFERDILAKAVVVLQNRSPQEFLNELDTVTSPPVLDIGKEVFTWGCSGPSYIV